MSDYESADSDSSDEDYVPKDGEKVSEEENSGEEEDYAALHKEAGDDSNLNLTGKRKRKQGKTKATKKRGSFLSRHDVSAENNDVANELDDANKEKAETKKKERSDSLWASFLSDVGQKPKPASSAKPVESQKPSLNTPAQTTPEKSRFHGNVNGKQEGKNSEVKPAEDKKLRAASKKAEPSNASLQPSASTEAPLLRKPAPVGLSGVLSQIGKQSKTTCLDKSKEDWEKFKKKEGISEELATFNRGKDGYMERVRFLERSDYRQFENERDLRLKTSKR